MSAATTRSARAYRGTETAGRSPEEMLAELERRLGNDDETEAREAIEQLRQIALLRLRTSVTDASETDPEGDSA